MVRIIQDNEEFVNIANHNKYGLERVLTENYAFIAESSSLDLMDPDKRCQVYQVGQPLASVFHGIGMQKSMNIEQSFCPQESSRYKSTKCWYLDSPYKIKVNQAILQFYADGTLQILRDKWIRNQDGCKINVDKHFT